MTENKVKKIKNGKFKSWHINCQQRALEKLISESNKIKNRSSEYYCQLIGYENHQSYILSSVWQNKRKEYKLAGFPMKCLVCNDDKVCLHHITYCRVGKERLNDLIPLCNDHHNDLHEYLSLFNVPVELSVKVIRLMMNWSYSQLVFAFKEYNLALLCYELTNMNCKCADISYNKNGISIHVNYGKINKIINIKLKNMTIHVNSKVYTIAKLLYVLRVNSDTMWPLF